MKKNEWNSEVHTPIVYKGHMFAVGKKKRGLFTCLSFDGKEVWTSDGKASFGLGSFLLADGMFFVLEGDTGMLRLIEASTTEYKELAKRPGAHRTGRLGADGAVGRQAGAAGPDQDGLPRRARRVDEADYAIPPGATAGRKGRGTAIASPPRCAASPSTGGTSCTRRATRKSRSSTTPAACGGAGAPPSRAWRWPSPATAGCSSARPDRSRSSTAPAASPTPGATQERLGRVTAIGFRNGNVLLGDAAGPRIRRYDAGGKFLNDIGKDNRMNGFLIPNGVVDFGVDAKGIIHAANPGKHRVERYTAGRANCSGTSAASTGTIRPAFRAAAIPPTWP